MRKCLRCETVMVEDLNVMVTNGGYGVDVREKGMFKSSLGKIKCAVCPECGYTETYIDSPENIKKLADKNKQANSNLSNRSRVFGPCFFRGKRKNRSQTH